MNFGLIGNPLGHSFSPAYFDKLFRENGIQGSYRLFPLERIDMLPAFLADHPELNGFNVTVPYKEAIIPYLDYIDEKAKIIGAVNTVSIQHEEDDEARPYRLTGYNTDFTGFESSVATAINHLKREPDLMALVLGTGGVSRAVTACLDANGIEYMIASRRPGSTYREGITTIGYDMIDWDILDRCYLIVNCTPLGMSPDIDTAPALPWTDMSPDHFCMDLVYNPGLSKFMRMAAERGCVVRYGLDMLHKQADEAWRIWNRVST